MSDFKTKLLRPAVPILNRIDDGKLNPLSTRVAASIVKNEQAFTEEEANKLEASLGILSNEINVVVSGIDEMLREATYHNMAVENLEHKLISLGLDNTKAAIFGNVWSKVRQGLTDAMKKISVVPQMSHLSYNLSIEAGRDNASQEKVVKGQLNIGLTNDVCNENLNLEFTHEELFSFHNQLARIQAQLDSMSDR